MGPKCQYSQLRGNIGYRGSSNRDYLTTNDSEVQALYGIHWWGLFGNPTHSRIMHHFSAKRIHKCDHAWGQEITTGLNRLCRETPLVLITLTGQSHIILSLETTGQCAGPAAGTPLQHHASFPLSSAVRLSTNNNLKKALHYLTKATWKHFYSFIITDIHKTQLDMQATASLLSELIPSVLSIFEQV